MVLLLTLHSYALSITSRLVCCLYPQVYGKSVGLCLLFVPSGFMGVQLGYCLTIFCSLLFFYCYLVGFGFRIVVVACS